MNKITKQELKKLYETKKNKEICELLGITNTTLISYLKRYGIKTKGRGNRMRQTKIELM